ncbi:MAG TPA: hypothetical protein DD453_08940, partial [Alteromonas macleodii]|nr:hypothetical protein [Alteromonas macleodii]
LNKNGWFANSGECIHSTTLRDELEAATALSVQNKILLRPSKAIVTAACCGHTWSFKSKRSPRALSLREMRLSTQINWKNFTLLRNNKACIE